MSRKQCTPTLVAEVTTQATQAIRLLPYGNRFISLDNSNGLQLYNNTRSLVSCVPGVGRMAETADLRLLPVSSEEVLLLHTLLWTG